MYYFYRNTFGRRGYIHCSNAVSVEVGGGGGGGGVIQLRSSNPEFVLSSVICYEKDFDFIILLESYK